MKKTNLFLLFIAHCSLLIVHCKAQDWAPTGSKWYYEIQPSVGCFPNCVVSYQLIESAGDTTIQGISCKILKKKNFISNCDIETTSYTFKRNDTVFWYNKINAKFTILYVFSSAKGDSWKIQTDTCSINVLVDSVGYKKLNNNILKVIYITSDDAVFTNSEIIENIGNNHSMFPYESYWNCPHLIPCEDNKIFGLRCYEDSTLGMCNYMKVPCDTIFNLPLSIGELYLYNKFNIYPNPFNICTNINYYNKEKGLVNISIYDFTGREVITLLNETKDKGEYTINLNTEKLHSGIYLCKITATDKTMIKKLVKL